MSANVGLSTPRGSGTSGYVQRNLSLLKPRDLERNKQTANDYETHKQRDPDPGILEHERKRRIEVKLFELRDKLEEEGVSEDEIDNQVEAYRHKLDQQNEANQNPDVRQLKAHQVHDLARAKIEETERVRKALGIQKDYQEGAHWRKQEVRKKAAESPNGPAIRHEDEAYGERKMRRSKYRDRDGERYEDSRARSTSPA